MADTVVDKKVEKKEKNKNEFIYFAIRNPKFIIGLSIFVFFILFATFGSLVSYDGDSTDFVGPHNQPPNTEFVLGTTSLGQDVMAQMVEGSRNSLIVGFLAGGIGTLIGLLIGFVSGYKGGIIDEILMMITNIFLVIPTIAILIILAAYLPYRGIVIESILIGCTAWPWVARAVRSQALSLRSRPFVDLSRISGVGTLRIIIYEVAPNMLSYVVMAFILQLSGAIMIAASLDFIGLGPTKGISLGVMMQIAFHNAAIVLGNWWWIFPPGIAITLIVSGLFFMNTGLDEVFNPKLREL